MREWWSKLRALLSRRKGLEDELREEIAAHIDFETGDNIERGMTPEAAQAAARRHFGNQTVAQERAHEAWAFAAWETFRQETRFALRGIRRTPGFSLVVIATLALGIGANTAIFSAVYSVLLKPLPFPLGERLMRLGESSAKAPGFSVSWMNYRHWLTGNRSFEDIAAYEQRPMTLTGRDEPLLLRVAAVTPGFFRMLGVRPIVGRLLDSDDERSGAAAVVVVSQNLWIAKLGGAANTLGAVLDLDGKSYQVAGVASSDPGFFLNPSDVYIPLADLHGREINRSQHGSIRALGRLKPGATLTTAQSDLDAIMAHLAQVDPGPESDHRSYLIPLAEVNRQSVRPTFLVLMGAVGLVLALACANVASLLLARGTARAREIAIRTALGASRFGQIRTMLMETALLSVFGGGAGLLVGYMSMRVLIGIAPRDIPHLADTTVDSHALLFTGVLTMLTGLLVSLAPIATSSKVNLVSALKENSQASTANRAHRSFRGALVVGEITVTLLLVFTSVLLVRSLITAQTRSPGFAPERLLALDLAFPRSYTTDQIRAFREHLTRDLRMLPGVESVAGVSSPPSGGDGDWFYSIPDKPTPAQSDVPVSLFNAADPGYFRAMAIPLIEGREFTETDMPKGPPVAIVNQTFARKWWPGESALGRQIKVGGPYRDGGTLEIIGVAGDVSQMGLDAEPMEEIFQPSAQADTQAVVMMIRASKDPAALSSAVRHSVWNIDRNLPIQNLEVFERTLAATLDRRRFSTLLLALFAGLAMSLAAVGIYGLLAYWVNVREKDIAIRLALGARRSIILRWVTSQALRLTVAGIGLGLAGAWIASRWLSSLVFGISAQNPATMVVAALAVTALTALASSAPAWRASRVDPVRKLHDA